LRLKFCTKVVYMFMNANILDLHQIEFWQPLLACNKLLEVRTVGTAFSVHMKDLVNFLDSLRNNRNRFFNVNHISIQNSNLLAGDDPVLEVQMLLTMGRFVGSQNTAASAPASSGAPMPDASAPAPNLQNPKEVLNKNIGPGGGGLRGRKDGDAGEAPPSKFQLWWRNFRRNYLPF
jgi:hypothetical protein